MCLSTGNKYLDVGLSVALGAVTGGLGLSTTATNIGLDVFGTVLANVPFTAMSAGAVGGAVIGLGTGVLRAALTPKQQDYSQYYQGAYNPIGYNAQQSQITGSGGRQAPALLAAEIKRAKKRREGQAAQGELGLATSLSNTGLQIA